jgi:predicted permease
MFGGLKVRLRALLRKGAMDRELDEEFLYHIEKQTARNVAGGMDPREARRVALRDFGGMEQMKEEVRDARGVRIVEDVLQDMRFGGRLLRKNPVFALVAIAILALGIGANTAIFSLVDAVVLKPLPVAAPDGLVLFADTASEGTSMGDPMTGTWELFSYPVYTYFRQHDDAFQDLCAFRSGEARLAVRREGAQSADAAERAQGHLVSGNYFDVLGVTASRGRALTPDDDAPSAPPTTVISHGYWQEKLGGDPSAIGRVVVLNGTSFTIAGVMPEGFFGVRVRKSPDFWLPLAFQPQIELQDSYFEDPDAYWLTLMGRTKDGVTLERAEAGVNVLLQQYLTAQAGAEITDERRADIQGSRIDLSPGARGISGLRSRYAEPLMILMAVVALILLIVCANVGNLLLSRSLARRREILVRLALGARRGRLIRQLVTESLLLAALGGALGVLLARWGASALVALVAPGSPLDVAPDAKALGFTAGVSLLAGIFFGLAPALHSSRTELWSGLKESSNRTAGTRQRFGLSSALVVVQVALSLVLLVGATMFARSLLNLQSEDLGFRGENLLLVDVDPRIAGYKPEELTDLYQRLLERAGTLPGVQTATIASFSPMSGTNRTSNISLQGYVPQPDEDMHVSNMFVGPKYGETLGLPLLAGRDIGPKDTVGAPKVALVNQAFADAFFPGQNPIGRRFDFGSDFEEKNATEIVGVVGNAKYAGVRAKPVRMAYSAILQEQTRGAFLCNLELRTVGDPLQVAPSIRSAVAQVDPRLPVVRVTSFSQQLEETLRQERLMAHLVAAFGVLALVLACVGLYGVMAQAVARRTNEIGVRMALGAAPGRILRLILGEVLAQVGVGMAIGLLGAAAAARLISSLLFGVEALDPAAITLALFVMFTTALLAGYVPARRATKVDPAVTLRYE